MRYLSPEWFEAVAGTLGATASVADARIGYVAVGETTGNGRVPRQAHTQHFCGTQLIAWTPGLHAGCELVLTRSMEHDAAHLLGHEDALASLAASDLAMPGQISCSSDVLGVGAFLHRSVGLPGGLSLVLQVNARVADHGALVRTYEVRGSALSTASRAPDVVVSGTADSILRWIHDPSTLCGHLITHEDLDVGGDLLVLSAIEGVISSPSSTRLIEAELTRRISRYLEAVNPLASGSAPIEFPRADPGFT